MDQPVIVHGRAAEVIDLPVRAAPPTGYRWTLDLPPGVTRVDNAPGKPDPQLGDAATGALRVTAPAGRHLITARLARPWEKDAPIRTVEIDLIVE